MDCLNERVRDLDKGHTQLSKSGKKPPDIIRGEGNFFGLQ